MRPIDADALSALLFERMGECERIANEWSKDSYGGCVYYGKTTALYEIQLAIEREMPTLDYAPVVHGEWKEEQNGFIPADICCSECGKKYNFFVPPNFCPNCGARNDGGKGDV